MLLLAACDRTTGLDRTGRGGPVQLVYAPPGTELKLLNASNGKDQNVKRSGTISIVR